MPRSFDQSFEYAGHELRVSAPDRATSVWLREFLCPQFDGRTDASGDWRIVQQVDDAGYHSLRERLTTVTPRPVECFSLDGHYEFGLLCGSGDSAEVVFDQRYKVFYRIDRPSRQIAMLSPDGAQRYRTALMRIMRELATAHCYRQAAVPVHGAAFEIGGKAVVIAGPKRTGKTTLLLRALLSGHCRYIANDRIFLFPQGDRVTARGMPTVVKIRQGSLELYPELRQQYLARPYYFNNTIDESLANSQCVTSKRRREAWTCDLRLSPAQLRDLCGRAGRQSVDHGASPDSLAQDSSVNSVASAPLQAIVFPHAAPLGRGCNWRTLPPAEAVSRLIEGLFLSGRPMQVAESFQCGPLPLNPMEEIERKCRAIVAATPCFQCFVGPAGIEPLLDLVDAAAA